jgi:hypothetical protein
MKTTLENGEFGMIDASAGSSLNRGVALIIN